VIEKYIIFLKEIEKKSKEGKEVLFILDGLYSSDVLNKKFRQVDTIVRKIKESGFHTILCFNRNYLAKDNKETQLYRMHDTSLLVWFKPLLLNEDKDNIVIKRVLNTIYGNVEGKKTDDLCKILYDLKINEIDLFNLFVVSERIDTRSDKISLPAIYEEIIDNEDIKSLIPTANWHYFGRGPEADEDKSATYVAWCTLKRHKNIGYYVTAYEYCKLIMDPENLNPSLKQLTRLLPEVITDFIVRLIKEEYSDISKAEILKKSYEKMDNIYGRINLLYIFNRLDMEDLNDLINDEYEKHKGMKTTKTSDHLFERALLTSMIISSNNPEILKIYHKKLLFNKEFSKLSRMFMSSYYLDNYSDYNNLGRQEFDDSRNKKYDCEKTVNKLLYKIETSYEVGRSKDLISADLVHACMLFQVRKFNAPESVSNKRALKAQDRIKENIVTWKTKFLTPGAETPSEFVEIEHYLNYCFELFNNKSLERYRFNDLRRHGQPINTAHYLMSKYVKGVVKDLSDKYDYEKIQFCFSYLINENIPCDYLLMGGKTDPFNIVEEYAEFFHYTKNEKGELVCKNNEWARNLTAAREIIVLANSYYQNCEEAVNLSIFGEKLQNCVEFKVKILQRHVEIEKKLAEYKIDRVLDLGCGEGKFPTLLIKNKRVEKYIGIDNDKVHFSIAHDKMEEFGNINYTIIEENILIIERAKMESDYKDFFEKEYAITLLDVIEHVEKDNDLKKLMEKVFGEFRPLFVFITTPDKNYNDEIGLNTDNKCRDRSHFFEFDESGFDDWISKVETLYGYKRQESLKKICSSEKTECKTFMVILKRTRV